MSGLEDKFNIRAEIVAHVVIVSKAERVKLFLQFIQQENGIVYVNSRLDDLVQIYVVDFKRVFEFRAQGVVANAGDFNLDFLWRLLVFSGAQNKRDIFQVLHELRNVGYFKISVR